MPTGRGGENKKNQKKKSKDQLERELKKSNSTRVPDPMTFEVVKPKRKERF